MHCPQTIAASLLRDLPVSGDANIVEQAIIKLGKSLALAAALKQRRYNSGPSARSATHGLAQKCR
jgi:hypothetical protein